MLTQQLAAGVPLIGSNGYWWVVLAVVAIAVVARLAARNRSGRRRMWALGYSCVSSAFGSVGL